MWPVMFNDAVDRSRSLLQKRWGGGGDVKEWTLTQMRLNLEFRQFEEDYPWLVKMQVWCPLMDEAD